MKKFLLIAGAFLFCMGMASANIVPSLVGSPTLQGSGNYLWSYQAFVDSQERLDPAASNSATACAGAPCIPPGTFWTIYDFSGFQGVQGTPGGWGFSTQNTGLTPIGVAPIPGDNASIINVTFTYTGAVRSGPFTDTGFNLLSQFGTQIQGAYSQQATNNTNSILNGQTDRGAGPISVPAGVPEPASLLLIGGGLAGLAIIGLKRIR